MGANNKFEHRPLATRQGTTQKPTLKLEIRRVRLQSHLRAGTSDVGNLSGSESVSASIYYYSIYG
jgi:hypothetical protein